MALLLFFSFVQWQKGMSPVPGLVLAALLILAVWTRPITQLYEENKKKNKARNERYFPQRRSG